MSKIQANEAGTKSPMTQVQIVDDRDYAIRKGKILEGFTQEFYTRHRDNFLYRKVLELLIRGADPYEVIEELIKINAEHYAKLMDVMPWVSPNYQLHKNKRNNE